MGELPIPIKTKTKILADMIYSRIKKACLTRGNTTAFTPAADYHPATKKYVDDEVSDLSDTVKYRTVHSFGYPSTISGANDQELEPGHRCISGSQATKGHLMTRDGSVTAVGIIVDVNANTGFDDLPFRIRTDDDTTLVTETISAPSTGNGHTQHNTFKEGTYTYSAGEVLCVRMDVPSGMTTDDVVVDVEVTSDT